MAFHVSWSKKHPITHQKTHTTQKETKKTSAKNKQNPQKQDLFFGRKKPKTQHVAKVWMAQRCRSSQARPPKTSPQMLVVIKEGKSPYIWEAI